MSGEILVEKPVTVPLYQKASIWNETESMPPRTEVDFSPLFSVAPDKCVCVCVCVWEGGGLYFSIIYDRFLAHPLQIIFYYHPRIRLYTTQTTENILKQKQSNK